MVTYICSTFNKKSNVYLLDFMESRCTPVTAAFTFDTYSMNTYFLLHIKHKNDVTIIVKLLYRATSLIMIKTSFLCLKHNRS